MIVNCDVGFLHLNRDILTSRISGVSPGNLRLHGRPRGANILLDVAADLILGWFVDEREEMAHALVLQCTLNLMIVID